MKVIIKNSNLVFQREHTAQVVYKDYWVRGQGQYVLLSALGTSVVGLAFNKYKGKFECYIDTNTTSSFYALMSSRSSYLQAYSSGAEFGWKNDSVSVSINDVSGASEHYIEFDNSVGTANIDGTPKSFTAPGTSKANYIYLFALGQDDERATAVGYSAGRFKFKRLRLYDATNDTLLCDIRPALVDNVPCLYDSVSETKLFSADGTTMVVEDAE